MRTQSMRQLTATAALAVATMAAAACGSAPVQALPQPSTATSATPSAPAPVVPSPGESSTRSAHPPKPQGVRPATGPRCRGAVTYRLDASDTGPPWPRLCITVGGVLRVENLGPEGFSVSPDGRISCWYEGGVRECRLIRTGTVRIAITHTSETRTLTLDIARPSSPPGPAPACLDARTTHVVDASDGGPPWAALCMRVGATVRFENHGPEGFSVSPPAAASCFYAAGVRPCRLVRPATVTFSFVNPGETRTLTVVAIR